MARVVLVQRVFATRDQAQSWFDSVKATAWPYVWCIEDLDDHHRWRVTALVEQHVLESLP